jgi:hypothetical protein
LILIEEFLFEGVAVLAVVYDYLAVGACNKPFIVRLQE